MEHYQVAPEGCSAVGNHKWTTTWWQGPTVNIRPALPPAVITMSCNYIWQTSNYQHNEANYYSASERRMSREHGGNLLPCLVDDSSPSALPPKNTSVKHAVAQHKQQKELLKWQTNWLLDSEPLCMGGSPLAITFLQSGDSRSCRLTPASLSFYLTVNPYCCWRTPGSEVQIVQNKTHTQTYTLLWGYNDTSAKGCLATGCVRGYGAQETRNVNTHTLTY